MSNSGLFLRQQLLKLQALFVGLVVLAAMSLFAAFDGFSPLEHALMDFRFGAAERPATQNLVIVEIDAKSLTELDTWPWPREKHATLIRALVDAGATRIAFDVDFSSRSNPENDELLAAAIKEANGRVILPAFGQRETTSHENTRTLSAEPLAIFREHALIGHVNIWPLGSHARTVRAGAFFGEVYRPAMAALISDEMVQTLDERYIDFSINPLSIPRLSYADVLAGRIERKAIDGKTIIIGGTAIELGDRLPVPRHGVLPGVTVQALAAESMSQNRTIARTSHWLSAGMGLMLLILFQAQALRGWIGAVCGAVILSGLCLVLSLWLQKTHAISLDLGPQFAILAYTALGTMAADLIDRTRKLRAERARSAARQALITKIVEDSSDGILAVDEGGQVVICNDKAADLFSTQREALNGSPIEALLPISATPFLGAAESAERFPFTFEHVIPAEPPSSAATVEVVVNKSLWQAHSNEPVFVLTLRDITARKRVEAAERRAAEEKLMAERSKNLFIANMSHELRTPLNAIIGFTEIIESETLGPLGHAKYREYADIVLKSGHHLLDMINHVLEISRLEAGGVKAERRRVELDGIIESAFGFIRNSRDYDDQRLSHDIQGGVGLIQTDPRLLKQILSNLLSNAIKFTKPDHKNSAVVRATATPGGGLRITVEDDGCGIAPEILDKVTELFYQGDGTFTRKHEGRGLGLYLVKKHIEILGGSLQFESTVGAGTRVHVDLPHAIVAIDTQSSAA